MKKKKTLQCASAGVSCGMIKNKHAVALGRLGGSVKGPCKSRGTEKARAAALARWRKKDNEKTGNPG